MDKWFPSTMDELLDERIEFTKNYIKRFDSNEKTKDVLECIERLKAVLSNYEECKNANGEERRILSNAILCKIFRSGQFDKTLVFDGEKTRVEYGDPNESQEMQVYSMKMRKALEEIFKQVNG